MKLLFAADSALEAHMILNLLSQIGITARIDGEYLQGGAGELQPLGVVRVMVEEEDFDEAQHALNEWEAQQTKENTLQTKGKSTTSLGLTMLAFIAGVILTLAFNQQATTTEGRDFNNDGILDEVRFYKNSYLEKTQIDRNLDRQADLILRYDKRGLISVAAQDNDFDGRFETVSHYKNGSIKRSAIDSDNDGFDEQIKHYQYGLLYQEQYFDQQSHQLINQIEYSPFGPLTAEVASHRQGKLDTRIEYDRAAREISKFRKPDYIN